MPRGLKNITASAAPKKKIKKRATSLATLKLGDEPSFISEPSQSDLGRALNWYKLCADNPDVHKEWVAEFLTRHGWNSSDVKVITSKIKKMLGAHIFIARLFNRNQPIDLKYEAEALSYFEKELKRREENLDEDGNPIVVKSAPRQNTKIPPMVLFIEEQIDAIQAGQKPDDVYAKLQAMGCNASTATQLKQIFKFQSDEFIELSKPMTCDDELLEAYKHLSTPIKKALGEFMKKLNDDLSSFVKVVKATRKPRKKKAVKVEKIVGKMKFKSKDDVYKIASIDPAKIIGASWLWTFNTKYRLIQFYEGGEGGLSVKGTTITNIKSSGQKKLRKPEQQLSNFGTGAVKTLPKHFDLIKTTSSEPNGRINQDTILLRAFT